MAEGVQGPSTKLILWFLHNTVHLGSIYQNIKVGIETYVIQALNEPLFDEIDRSRDELWMLEGRQLGRKKSRFARFSFFRCRTSNQNFSINCGPIATNSIDLGSCTIEEHHIEIWESYLVSLLRYDAKREPHFFDIGDSCTFCLSQKGKNMRGVRRKIRRLYNCLFWGIKTKFYPKTTVNKVVANTSRKKKSSCPFYLEV